MNRSILALSLLALASAASPTAAISANSAAASGTGFKVVGYQPTWGGGLASIQYKKLTHINWAFAAPADDGSLSGYDGAQLNQLVASAHANNVKVFLAIGGGANGDNGWQVCTASDAPRKAFVAACMGAVHTYALDGIDIDWEYPDGAQVAGFNVTVKLLSAALHAEGKQLSAAVTMNDWPKSFPTRELYDLTNTGFDFLNIMVYDNPKPHSTVAAAQSGLDTWIKTKGLPKEKAVLGCPFYNSAGLKYKDIVAANPAAAWVDSNGNEDYNSIPTLKKKTEMALAKAGGIMFWELSQDAVGDLSLLSAVDADIRQHNTIGIRAAAPFGGVPPMEPLMLTSERRGRLLGWRADGSVARRSSDPAPMIFFDLDGQGFWNEAIPVRR